MAFAVALDGEGASLFDHMWLDERLLAVAALRLDGRGLDGALALASMRHLLRALLLKLEEPAAVLDQLPGFSGRERHDVAIACLDVASGMLSSAGSGNGSVTVGNAELAAGQRRMTPGAIVWLSAGGKPSDLQDRAPVEGLQAVVDPALKRSGAGAIGAVLFKACVRGRDSATFSVRNDRAEIPTFLTAARRFFARQNLAEEDVAELEVALDEILTNQVNYGYRDGLNHEILVSMTVEAGRLLLEIRDDGEPFDPLGVPEPDLSSDIEQRQIGGLGMHFVRRLLDKVEYQRRNGWNVLTLRKNLS
ncbi:ATP-binding protein [Nitratireductor sp. GCM10026969]|uniref:ATP-binding protein n=1 Tax=Nitratireductor sp. GCM10026969 TaxID=3252645 RepID=UPI00360AACB2